MYTDPTVFLQFSFPSSLISRCRYFFSSRTKAALPLLHLCFEFAVPPPYPSLIGLESDANKDTSTEDQCRGESYNDEDNDRSC